MMKADSPIQLADITQMTEEERENLLNQIRERRLAPVKVYEELTEMMQLARSDQLELSWTKQMEMFVKELARVDKALEALASRSTKLRAIRLELDDMQ